MEKFGVVVIGIGRAGNARIRDLQNLPQDRPSLQRLKLIGYISRRKLDLEIPSMTLDDALARVDVHVIMVCTEPGVHEQVIRKSLNAGKHVLVEYPLVIQFAVAKELYQLASDKGVILHEENIGMLSCSLHRLKEEVQKKPPLLEGQLTAHTFFNGWNEKFEENGYPFTIKQSLIKNLVYLFGDLTPVGGQLIKDEKGYVATGDLRTKDDKKITLKIILTKERIRWGKDYLLKFEDGSIIDKEPENLPRTTETGLGYFMEDLLKFSEKLVGERDVHNYEDFNLRGLEIAEGIQSFFKGTN